MIISEQETGVKYLRVLLKCPSKKKYFFKAFLLSKMISWLTLGNFWAGNSFVHILMRKTPTMGDHQHWMIWFCEPSKKHFLAVFVLTESVYTVLKVRWVPKERTRQTTTDVFFLLLTHSDVSRLSPLSLCSFKCLVVACILFSFPLVKWITSRKRYSRVRAGTVATIH